MSNLNIQQKVSLITQKTKETKVKDSNLSDEQLRINDFNENIKPNLPEDQIALIQKYQTKLSVLGEYKEVNIYDMMKRYDWNVKVLDDLTSVLIQRWEEAKDSEGWKEVKRVSKPAVTKKAKEAEDIKRPRRNEGEELDTRDRSRNFKGAQRTFKDRARRGQSVGNRNEQHEDEGDYQEDRGYQREDKRARKRDRGEREVIMYVKKGEQEPERDNEEAQKGRKQSEEVYRRGRERVMYVPKNKETPTTIGQGEETGSGRAPQTGRGRKQQQRQPKREENVEEENGGWQNEDSFEEPKENKPVEKVEKPVEKPVTTGREQQQQQKQSQRNGRKEYNTGTGVVYVKKETQSSQQAKAQESLSPVRHYNEHNIHEFFKAKEGGESAKKEANREPERTVEVVSQPKAKEEKPTQASRQESENVEKPKQREVQNQPIGANRNQSSQNTTTTTTAHTTQQTAQNATPSPQTTAQNLHPAQSPQNPATQTPHGENFTNDANKQTQQMPQAYGFPQYPQQPYFMPQFPQQPMFNPYMAYTMPQAQPQGGFSKDQQQQQQQQQQQVSYPPGFNPQDMSMFQVQYMLIPQPNGPPILQPIFPMMPQVMGMGVQRPGEGEQQQKYAQPYYQFPVNMPNTPAEFYGNDDKKSSSRHATYDNKQSATPNTGNFFTFSNEPEHKKNQGSYMPQQGYQYMPFVIPTMHGAHPGQQHQGKQNEGTGNSALKSDYLYH